MVKIAASPTVAEAYRILLGNIGKFFHLAGGWLTCLLALVVVKMLPWPGAVWLLLVIVTLLVFALAAAAFSVGWYRAILLDEAAPNVISLSIGARELRYVAHQGAIVTMIAVPLLLLSWLIGAQTWWASAFAFLHGGAFQPFAVLRLAGSLALLLSLIVVSVFASARLMIALPAASIDEPGRLLADAWRHSSGNTAPLFFGWLGCVLPALVFWGTLSAILAAGMGPLAGPLVELAAYPCAFAALAVSGGFFSFVYAQLAGAAPAAEGEPSPDEVAAAQ